MLYVKVKEGQVETFPYSIDQLKKENPNTSFPSVISNELLASFNVYPVAQGQTPSFDSRTQKLTRNITFTNQQWTQSWSVTSLPQSTAEQNVRGYRDRLLSDTDWIVTKSYEQGIPTPTQWVTYRQALRDITAQVGFPYQVVWPNIPK